MIGRPTSYCAVWSGSHTQFCLVPSLFPHPRHVIQHEGSASSNQTTVDKETDEKLKEINQAFDKNKDAVVKKLLDRVTDVKPEVHRNLQLKA